MIPLPKIKFETKIVEHEGKKIKMPFDCQIYPEKQVTIANRFTGQKCTMPGFAASDMSCNATPHDYQRSTTPDQEL